MTNQQGLQMLLEKFGYIIAQFDEPDLKDGEVIDDLDMLGGEKVVAKTVIVGKATDEEHYEQIRFAASLGARVSGRDPFKSLYKVIAE